MATKKKKGTTPIAFGWTAINEYEHTNFTDGSLTTKSPLILLSSKGAGTIPGYIEQYKIDINHPTVGGARKKGDLQISAYNNVRLNDVEAYSALPDPFIKEPAGE